MVLLSDSELEYIKSVVLSFVDTALPIAKIAPPDPVPGDQSIRYLLPGVFVWDPATQFAEDGIRPPECPACSKTMVKHRWTYG